MTLALALSLSAVVSAHHPITLSYFIDRTEAVEGDLVQLALQNPHSYLYVDAPDGAGHPRRWVIEWLSGFELRRQGVTVDTFKIGDRVVITGLPGKNPEEHRLRLRTLVRPRDQWHWSGVFE